MFYSIEQMMTNIPMHDTFAASLWRQSSPYCSSHDLSTHKAACAAVEFCPTISMYCTVSGSLNDSASTS